MQLTFVVPRYGATIGGGAERYCRDLAMAMVGRGHRVEVVTSCATSYAGWENALPPGVTDEDGVSVLRMPVDHPRRTDVFNRLHDRVLRPCSVAPARLLLDEWMRAQGPWIGGLADELVARVGRTDAFAFFPYVYATTWLGLRAVSGRAPTVLHPCAHDEPALHLPLFDDLLRRPDAHAFLTPEEQHLFVRRTGAVRRRAAVVGSGVDTPPVVVADGPVPAPPFVLFLGRVDPGKGTNELFDYFVEYKRRRGGPVRLVLAGDPVVPPPPHPDVDLLGSVDDDTKWRLLARAEAVVVPSYFESFSLVLAEAWAMGRAALVQGRCDVLAGQARRSGGAIAYEGYRSFEAALDRVLGDAGVRAELGARGREYVATAHTWDAVVERYERLLSEVVPMAR